LAEQGQQSDRVDVEDRFTTAADSRAGIIAGQHEEVVKPLAREMPGFAFESIPIEILAGKVNHDLAVRIAKGTAQRRSREHGIAAGIIGDRDPIDLRASGEIAGKLHRLRGIGLRHRAPRGNQFHADQEIARALKFIRKSVHRILLPKPTPQRHGRQ